MLPQLLPFVPDRDRLLEMEDAIETAKSICNSDAQSCLVVLLAMEHASTDKVNVTKHKRSLEDTLMGSLIFKHHSMLSASRFLRPLLHLGNLSPMTYVTLTFTDPFHAGGKRKRCQACSSVFNVAGGAVCSIWNFM